MVEHRSSADLCELTTPDAGSWKASLVPGLLAADSLCLRSFRLEAPFLVTVTTFCAGRRFHYRPGVMAQSLPMDASIESNPSSAGDRAPAVAGSIEDAEWCREIAGKIGAGDSAAEAVLLDRLRPGLEMVLIARCSYDKELAADLCQDTLVIVLQRLRRRSMEDPSRLAAFAAQTARQLAFDSRRRYAVRNTVADSDAVERAQVEAPPDDSVEKESTTSLVRKLLAELSHDRDREILRRFYLLEHDKPDICRQLGLAPGAFDQVVFRARARLRAMLEARGVGSRDLMCVLIIWIPKSWRR